MTPSQTDELRTHTMLPIDEIFIDQEFNCRGQISHMDVADLAQNIEEHGGLIQPVTVAELNDEQKGRAPGKKYILLAGYRRTLAHQVLGRTHIECIIDNRIIGEEKQRVFNLSENLQRKDLNIGQEARGIQPLFDLGMSEQGVMKALNKPRGWVQIRKMFLHLPKEIQDEVIGGRIIQSEIRELYTQLKHTGETDTIMLAKKMKDNRLAGRTEILKAKVKGKNTKRNRSRGEIFALLEQAQQFLPMGLWSRCLAWAAGEIDDEAIQGDLKEAAEAAGKTYVK